MSTDSVETLKPATTVPPWRDRITPYAYGCAFLSSVSLVLSIAVAQTLLVIALVLLLLSNTRLRLPPVAWPLAGFLGWTLLSMAASDDPSAGWPQIKKFLVFTVLLVVFSVFSRVDQARRLFEALFVCTLAAALVGIVQFAIKLAEASAAGQDFYDSYVGQRITGFFGHWMTFSQVLLMVFLMLAGYVLFSRSGRRFGRAVWWGCSAVFGVALVLSGTRSVWAASLLGIVYLLWHSNRRVLWLGPVALVLLQLASPRSIERRVTSLIDPQAYSARVIMWRTGARMVEAHPWFGVGPMRVGPRFAEFQPADITELPLAYYEHLHNVFIHYAAERGIPAALFLLLALGKVLWDHRRALAKLPAGYSDERFLLHGVIAATLGLGVVSCSDVSLGDSEILGVYLTVIALGYRAVDSVSRRAAAGTAAEEGSGSVSTGQGLRS